MSKQIRVFADGTFDLLHPNHITFLENARALGDHLIVGVMSDANVMTYKAKPVMNEIERLRMISALRIVDEAFIVSKPLVRDTMQKILDKFSPDKVVYSGGGDFNTYYGPAIERGLMVTPDYLLGINSTNVIKRVLDRAANS